MTFQEGKSEAAQPFPTTVMRIRNEAGRGWRGKMIRLLMFVTLGLNDEDDYLPEDSVRKSDGVRFAKLRGLTGSVKKLPSMTCVRRIQSYLIR